MSDVQLTISKEIVTPIVEAKVKEAILAAMGGQDALINGVVETILKQKVDKDGKVSNYSSENKYTWIDIVLTKQIQEAVREQIKSQIVKSSSAIKDSLVKQLQTKKGSDLVAKALMDSMAGSFTSSWTSKIAIDFKPKE